MGELKLTLLGGSRVTCDGAPLTGWTLQKSLALLAYLAVTGRPPACSGRTAPRPTPARTYARSWPSFAAGCPRTWRSDAPKWPWTGRPPGAAGCRGCARELAQALGIHLRVVELEGLHAAAEATLGDLLEGGTPASSWSGRRRPN